jgi:hypothetical protein
MVQAAIVLLLLALLPTAAIAQTDKRIALVIGNKDYKASVGSLINPLNDIRIVGEALEADGFEVLTPVQNGKRADVLIAIYKFGTKLKVAGSYALGFLYYSGHGVASAGENYLIRGRRYAKMSPDGSPPQTRDGRGCVVKCDAAANAMAPTDGACL